MPYLPLYSPEPLSATLGIMLYPGLSDDDSRRAKAFAAYFLGRPIEQADSEGYAVEGAFLRELVVSGGEPLLDLKDRYYWGTAVGQMFKTFFALDNTNRKFASWHRAIELAQKEAKKAGLKGSKRALLREVDRFATVAHLWGAWAIRDGEFTQKPDVGYDGLDDFYSFVAEAEALRHWSQDWSGPRSDARPPLPSDAWRAPADWLPPVRQMDWPDTGCVPIFTMPDGLLETLKPSGRPRKSAK